MFSHESFSTMGHVYICMDVYNIYIILDISTGILGYGTILSLELIDEHISRGSMV